MGDMGFPSSAGIVDAPPVSEPLPWYSVWVGVVARPSRDSFRRILADPTARPARAFTWVAAVGGVFGLLRLLTSLVGGADLLRGVDLFGAGNLGFLTSPLGLAISAPVLAVAGLALGAAILRGIAAFFQGAGNYGDLVYCLGAVAAPTNVVSGLISLVTPVAGGGMALISLAVVIYTIVLDVLAVDTVEKFGTNRAALTVLAPVAAAALFGLCWVVNYFISAMSRMGP